MKTQLGSPFTKVLKNSLLWEAGGGFEECVKGENEVNASEDGEERVLQEDKCLRSLENYQSFYTVYL